MLLCDQVVAMKEKIGTLHGRWESVPKSLRKIVDIANGLREAPRFILANDVTEALITSSTDYPEALAGCIDVIRIPWQVAWFEWDDDFARETWHRAHVKPINDAQNFKPKRSGFLVEADPDGRSGVISVCWPIPDPDDAGGNSGRFDQGLVMTSFQTVRFDLDRKDLDPRVVVGTASLQREIGMPVPDIGFSTESEPARSRYLDRIRATMSMDWSGSGASQFVLRRDGLDPLQIVHNAVVDIWSEYCMLVPAAAMMNAHQAVKREAVDRSKLNKNRLKAGRPPLLDHHVVSMNVSPEERAERRRAAAEGVSGPRATHWVRGHLVHRGETIYWRRPHIRVGVGDTPAGRTIRVNGRPDLTQGVDDFPCP